MELGSGGSDFFRESRLDVHVDVFELDGELEVARGDVLLDLAEAGFDLREFLAAQEAGIHLRARVGDGAGDIMRVEAPIVGDGFSVLLHEICGLGLEAAFPHGGRVSGEWRIVKGECERDGRF